MATFINPFVDRGFKIIFGRDESKALLIDLLNDLFENEHVITDLSYLNIEMPADCTDSRTAIKEEIAQRDLVFFALFFLIFLRIGETNICLEKKNLILN